MAEPYDRPADGGMPEAKSQTTRRDSDIRRSNLSPQAKKLLVNEQSQKPGGGVPQDLPVAIGRPHSTHDGTPTSRSSTPLSRSSSQRSASRQHTYDHPPINAPAMLQAKHPDSSSRSWRGTREDLAYAYDCCPCICPVNKDSMAELETSRIINNPKLRNDINYDRELHFRPNLDGQHGERKMAANDKYWAAVGYELQMIEDILRERANPQLGHSDEHYLAELRACKRRLPHVFTAVRDILISLVPQSDQQHIRERLDIEFLMQQIDNGVCDLKDLATWLAKVITTHCAPMRDSKVASMAKTVIEATESQKTAALADGLRQLIDIMEAMKLDVANHQIRHIRTHLIMGTVSFQKKYNDLRVFQGKIDIERSQQWLAQEFARTQEGSYSISMLDALCSALLNDMAKAEVDLMPTFYLDKDRLRGLSAEMHSYLCREVCQSVMITLLPDEGEVEFEACKELQPYLTAVEGPHSHFVSMVEDLAAQFSHIAATLTSDSTMVDPDMQRKAANLLRVDLDQHSFAYGRQRDILVQRLVPKLRASVNEHIHMTPLQLQDALLPTAMPTSPRRLRGFGAVLEPVKAVMPVDPDQTLIRKLTHIIVIHWQVWKDHYLASTGDDLELQDLLDAQDRATTLPDILCRG